MIIITAVLSLHSDNILCIIHNIFVYNIYPNIAIDITVHYQIGIGT